VARDFSPGALKILRERDSNWVDESGDARIVGPSRLFVVRLHGRAEPATAPQGREAVHLVALAVALAEAILANPNEAIMNSALAELTDFSPPQISPDARSVRQAGLDA